MKDFLPHGNSFTNHVWGIKIEDSKVSPINPLNLIHWILFPAKDPLCMINDYSLGCKHIAIPLLPSPCLLSSALSGSSLSALSSEKLAGIDEVGADQSSMTSSTSRCSSIIPMCLKIVADSCKRGTSIASARRQESGGRGKIILFPLRHVGNYGNNILGL